MTEKVVVEIEDEKIIGILQNSSQESDACVISCHGLLASKDSPKYIMLAEALNKIGISSIRFDFRGCGESDGKLEESHISNRLKDLKAVFNHVNQDLNFECIGLFGSSMGGFISFLMASSEAKVKVLVSLSSPISMRELFFANPMNDDFYEIDGVGFGRQFLLDVKEHGILTPETLAKINCPTHIFHGDADWVVPTSHAHRLYENLKTEKKLQIITAGDHIFSNPFHLEMIIRKSTDWYKKFLTENG